MKTTKAILVAVLMAFASFGFSQSEGVPRTMDLAPDYQISISIQLRAALSNPGLVTAMHSQLNISMLRNDQQYYTLRVAYRNITYFVTGTKTEWKAFFSAVRDAPPES